MRFLDHALKSDNPSHIRSIQKAIVIIELLASEGEELSLTKISQKLDWPKSTVHGILSTLRDFQYIDQSRETGCYFLGVRFFELGNLVARKWNIQEIARPIMRRLHRQTAETIQLGVESQGEILYLEKIDSNDVLSIVSNVGGRLPMHCSALGKVLLANMSSGEVERIVKIHGLKRFTNYTITTPQALKRELDVIRQTGFAYDNNEIMEGLRCVAFPIYEPDRSVRYAISISGLSSHLKGETMEKAIESLRSAAKEISELLE